MTNAVEHFVVSYTPGPDTAIAFAWNGTHAADFEDANQEFRAEVAAYCLSNPEKVSAPLLEDLLRADAKWSSEAWGVPNRFHWLAALFLTKAGPAGLPVFQECAFASFDTYGACHRMRLPADLLQSLLSATNARAAEALDEAERKQLAGMAELFTSLAAGTAGKGWIRVGGGPDEAPPVNAKQSLWRRLLSLLRWRAA